MRARAGWSSSSLCPWAARSLTRQWLGDGVTVRTLRTDPDQVAGVLALPPAGSPARVAVLAIGGSGGGVGMAADAALLASHGYPTLALAYFHHPGRPDQLRDIPLEYFATAARRLATESGVRRGRVATLIPTRRWSTRRPATAWAPSPSGRPARC